jgi:hypothetical protein
VSRFFVLSAPGCLTAFQVAKSFQIDRLGTFRHEIGVDEVKVSEFIIGIVMDVLWHVPVEHFERSYVRSVPAPAGDLRILNSPKFVVLLPKIRLQNFERGKKSQNINIALGNGMT